MSTSTIARTLWHASRAAISRPTIAGRQAGDNHPNSGLGIYCATRPADYIVSFGATIHCIALHDDVRIMRLSIADLLRMGSHDPDVDKDRAWFDKEGRRLGGRYDVIDLVEHDGRVEQAIILNDSAIAQCDVIDPIEFAKLQAPPIRPGGFKR